MKSISFSSLSMFLRCPAQWERRYLNREIIPPGIAGRRGGSVHKAAEINHLQKLNSQEDLPVSDLQDAARDHYVKTIREKGVFIPKAQAGEKIQLLNDGLNATVRLTKLYREELAPEITPALVEEKIEIDAGFPWPLVMVIDCLTADNHLPDIKTSEKSKNQTEADNSLQLTTYAGGVAHITGKWPEEVSLEVLVDNKTPKRQSLKSKRGPADWANLMLRIQLMVAQIQTGLFPPCDPNSWACDEKWCGYALTCKYYHRR